MGISIRNSILIVDSDAASHIFLTRLLSADYNVYTAKDGQSGLWKAKEIIPDLILLDILMSGMSGFEVLDTLRGTHETRGIPIIFLTGQNSSADEIRWLSSDAADYISKPFNADIVKLRVRNQIRIINQIRTINRLSTTDQLTGLPNRRGFDNQLYREWGRSMREKLPLGLMFIDIDNFKIYNDTYGYQQGDVVLKAVADHLLTALRRSADFGARWGSEEFSALVPNTDLEGVMHIAEFLRERIEHSPIPLVSEDPTNITISIGINSQIPTEDMPEAFIFQTDKALQKAKFTGRNRVCH